MLWHAFIGNLKVQGHFHSMYFLGARAAMFACNIWTYR